MYARNEQETTCVYDYLEDEWVVYSNVRKHLTKLFRRFGEPMWSEEENGRVIAAKWKAKGNQIRFSRNTQRKASFKEENSLRVQKH